LLLWFQVLLVIHLLVPMAERATQTECPITVHVQLPTMEPNVNSSTNVTLDSNLIVRLTVVVIVILAIINLLLDTILHA